MGVTKRRRKTPERCDGGSDEKRMKALDGSRVMVDPLKCSACMGSKKGHTCRVMGRGWRLDLLPPEEEQELLEHSVQEQSELSEQSVQELSELSELSELLEQSKLPEQEQELLEQELLELLELPELPEQELPDLPDVRMIQGNIDVLPVP